MAFVEFGFVFDQRLNVLGPWACGRDSVAGLGVTAPEKTLQIVCNAVCRTTGNTLINVFCPRAGVFKLNPSGKQRDE